METEIVKKRTYRVIHLLEDGRKKYSSHRGTIEKWRWYEIEAMEMNRRKYGDSAFLADFSKYDVVAADLEKRYPNKKIVRVIGYEVEDCIMPLNPEIII